ncbi:FHA domain-containing protein [Purpureocillium lavendulum]|uniref:RING-type E3 ubiquitin transferase n=1 Tax=Purpureocillium lavendulum TaxID=1247861 RepID=A0AB34FRZ5_9HYPO|nr:FHA domain-containing protein [Purpureocillium lavendulum]
MFTQPVSSPPPGPQTASPVSPTRPSRLRGLSYLRNYTQHHILSRDSSSAGNSNSNSNSHHAAVSGTTTTTTTTTTSSPARSSGSGHGHGAASFANLTRSVSYTPSSSSSAIPTAPAHNPNRLTLVSSNPDPSSAHARMPSSTSHPESIPEATATVTPHAAAAAAAAPTADEHLQSATMPHNATATADAAATTASTPETTPSIRFSAYYDPRSTRPSLSFPPISRTLPNGTEVIRVGRYSERDGQAANMAGNQPSAAPVGFKSKVVSRRHCEFWCEDGKWYIRDVKSSSGTFLNHIRLSPPSQESKAYPVNDGDIVQLGIDFKGGEEMIFRCVKMRLELNRGWQNKLNTFNVAAHKRLRTMATTTNGAASSVSSSNSQDCSICLNSIAPCQSLFVAPCSHTWHFKCVRSLLSSPQYPIFVCPNCRAGADLEADVEEPDEEWQQLEDAQDEEVKPQTTNGQPPEAASEATSAPAPAEPDAMDTTMDVTVNPNACDSPGGRSNLPHEPTEPVPIRNPASGAGRVNQLRENRSPSPHTNGEGPITPRNNAGPWVFDGGAGRRVADPTAEMTSLDAATEMDLSGGGTSDASSH